MQTPPPTDVFRLFVRDRRESRERLIFNPQRLASPDGWHHSLDLYHAAPNGEHVVCRVSRGGSEETMVYVVSVSDGRIVGKPIDHAEGGNITSSRHEQQPPHFAGRELRRRPFPHNLVFLQRKQRRYLGVSLVAIGGVDRTWTATGSNMEKFSPNKGSQRIWLNCGP